MQKPNIYRKQIAPKEEAEMSNTMKEIYKSYAKRFLLCIGSLIFFGLGNAWGVKAAAAGTNAWSTLSIGVADKLGTTFGIANMGIGVIIIIIDIFSYLGKKVNPYKNYSENDRTCVQLK